MKSKEYDEMLNSPYAIRQKVSNPSTEGVPVRRPKAPDPPKIVGPIQHAAPPPPGVDLRDLVENEALPFPDKDISPALQRTLKKKLDRGENDAIPRKDWDRAMQRVAGEEPPGEE